MMATRLLLFLCLTGHVFAKEPPDVECLVMHLEYIHCSWNKDRTPEVNYTFYSGFHNKTPRECPSYFSENSINTGCKQPYLQTGDRFSDFNTKLVHGNDSYEKIHELTERVKFNPPSYLQLFASLNIKEDFYYLQQTSPVFLKLTDTPHMNSSMSVLTPVLCGLGAFILILLVMILLHHERIRIILIPVVPKPSLPPNVEDWFQFPKGLKESFKDNERPCPVREYCHVPESDSESSDCSTCSGTTDQTDCSVSIPVNESDLPTSCSSSTSTVSPEEEKQVSV
ncbi:uncharacterized protein [Notothenia coriiceps]|uniref:Cytokine receptor-like factor 2-like D1 domain-containing protein n=1 Tax=Notothenia coriiceps TaxID=8208 RepID=A0A6I9Q3B7_9TELE|nr:PREDICTED: uncharacterized protein LOC104967331 [Notothenia coriiceps]